MTRRVFDAALAFALNYGGDSISIGGGEPTIHPHFWQYLGVCIAEFDYVWMATNGSMTKTALALAKMAKRGIIGVALSQDSYHDQIDGEVIQAFQKKGKDNHDYREIRCVDGNEIDAGRCDFGGEGCACEDILITPTGDIRACGCSDAPSFGTVFLPLIPDEWEWGTCHKNQ